MARHRPRAYDSHRRSIPVRSSSRKFASLLLAVALVSPLAMIGCRSQETVYYNQWEHDTHREHVDLSKRSADEQREYAEWRRSRDDHH